MHIRVNRLVSIILVALSPLTYANTSSPIQLAPPDVSGGRSLMQALKDRQSTKAYRQQPISHVVLSELLWAAFGINRPESGKRTAPSAMNSQEMDIYVVFQQGTYRYEAKEHRLLPVCTQDVRKLVATQTYAQVAPINLVYIADYARLSPRVEEQKKPIYAAFHAGAIAQNVHLYCASVGLGAVVRDGIDRKALHKAFALRPDQAIVMGQTVGYPEE
ncbi:SagB/ThcOx family dehydrogenase [Planctomycetota bacterium]